MSPFAADFAESVTYVACCLTVVGSPPIEAARGLFPIARCTRMAAARCTHRDGGFNIQINIATEQGRVVKVGPCSWALDSSHTLHVCVKLI